MYRKRGPDPNEQKTVCSSQLAPADIFSFLFFFLARRYLHVCDHTCQVCLHDDHDDGDDISLARRSHGATRRISQCGGARFHRKGERATERDGKRESD